MSPLSRIVCRLLALAGLGLPVWAESGETPEPATVRVEVHVTSLTTGEVWLDAGREEGLEPGDRVRLEPLGAATVEAVVLSVSSNGARARLEGPADKVDVGTPGTARVPARRLERESPPAQPAPASSTGAQPGAAPAPDAPTGPIVPVPPTSSGAPAASGPTQDGAQHPQWSAPPEEWTGEMPLLAPPQVVAQDEPADKEVEWRGYAFVDAQGTWDDGRDYYLARTGVDLEAENLLGHGGRLQIDIEAYARGASLTGASDDSESRVRVDRLSYLWGGDRDSPMSIEGGRFLQQMMPEFGVIDGFEWTQRLSAHDRVGASVGFLPDWSPEMSTGDDVEVSAAWHHLVGENDQLETALGFQKTWHKGTADRDLAVGTVSWRPDPTWSVYGSAWVDFYGSNETVKSAGAELTQANLNVSKRFGSVGGLSFFGTRMLFPDLLRYEYEPVEPTTLDDFENTRYGLSAWREIAKKVRLSGRASFWMDDTDSGVTGEVRLGVRDRILSRGLVELALFGGDGKYGKVKGARLGVSRSFDAGTWLVSLESALNEQSDFTGAQAELWQHTARVSYDRDLGEHWDLSLWGDQRFGDEQQATTAGFTLRRRF